MRCINLRFTYLLTYLLTYLQLAYQEDRGFSDSSTSTLIDDRCHKKDQ